MTVVDREVVSKKLDALRRYVEGLQGAADITWQKYQTDERSRAFVERYLHLAAECAIDIANHIVSFEGWREPAGYRDLFAVLAEHGVLPTNSLARFQDLASFRNLLVHRYDKIDDEIVFGIFAHRLSDLQEFARLVGHWVASKTKS